MRKTIYLLFISTVLNGCFMNSHTNKQLIDPYYLIAADSESQMTISEKINDDSYVGIIAPTVFEYSIYEDFILAKNKEYSSPNKEVEYYILNTSIGKVESYTDPNKFKESLKRNNIPEDNLKWLKAY